MHPTRNPLRLLIFAIFSSALPAMAAAGSGGWPHLGPQDSPEDLLPDPGLKEIQVLEHENLKDVTSVAVSPDNKTVYAAAFNKGLISILDRNGATGRLTFRKSITDPNHRGAVAFRLSNDGSMGASSCFGSAALILYSVHPDNGDLEILDVAGGIANQVEGLNFCIDNVFSPDGRFLYSVGSSAIGVFRIEDGKLIHVETVKTPAPAEAEAKGAAPPANRMSGGRGIAVSPNGANLYTTWCGSDALMVHRRDPETGKLTLAQALEKDGELLPGLEGVMRVTTSRDGHFVYTSGGRFGGINAVCSFEVQRGHLTLVQTLSDKELPPNFRGGNEIVLSPNQREATVACTLSDTVARFQRDPINGRLHAIGSEEAGPMVDPGPAGLVWSNDGKHLYVADEESSCIVTFRKR